MKIAIIGGGASGFFSAITVKENYPNSSVIIFEKSLQVLSKVKISGGGRCNVTNGCDSIAELCKAYPRGGKNLKKQFSIFNTKHAFEWFESRGVRLVIQDDNCVFPESQNSQSIIDCLVHESRSLGVEIRCGKELLGIVPQNEKLELQFAQVEKNKHLFDKVIVAIGGIPKRKDLEWLEKLGHTIENPIPSLFTFNMPHETITQLMGIVVENALVSIQGTNLKSEGPLLITHWGMSGPAILKLSSYGARIVHDLQYNFTIRVNWVHEQNNDLVIETLQAIVNEHSNKLVTNVRPYDLPSRLWLFILEKCNVSFDKKWGEIGKKGLNKIMNCITNDEYKVNGTTTFRDEFVTCGGVSLESVNLSTMQSKVCKNLYFTGEVLDIDGITGGFNFQNAWTTGYIAGKLT